MQHAAQQPQSTSQATAQHQSSSRATAQQQHGNSSKTTACTAQQQELEDSRATEPPWQRKLPAAVLLQMLGLVLWAPARTSGPRLKGCAWDRFI